MFSLIEEMKEGKGAHPALAEKFEKAKDNLLRETKNYRLDTPYEIASYNSRLIFEENVWYVDDYIAEMEGPYADTHPLTLEECARVAQECLQGRLKVRLTRAYRKQYYELSFRNLPALLISNLSGGITLHRQH